jgi:lipid-A-disaccharide synthase
MHDSADRPIRFALVAGEASGDMLGAGLVHALRERFPDAQFAGVCGPAMREAGVEAWADAGELAVMGLSEVLAHLPRLLRLRKGLRERILAWRPDAFIGIDAPDFNLGLERWLKRRGVRTVHYVGPSVWAWRESRARKIGASADRVLCLFPMEPPIYARHGVDAVFVGHPLADAIPLDPDRAAARAALGIAVHDPVLALLPGSRLGEIDRMLPVFLEAAAGVAAEFPDLKTLIPAANPACRAAIERTAAGMPVAPRILDGDAQKAMIASDVVLLASGTAALEAMLCKRPMVIGHRIAPMTHAIVRGMGLLKSRFVSLPNVLAGEALVPELLQDDCTAPKLRDAVLAWLRDPEAAIALRPRFRAIHEGLRRDASARAAEAVAGLLGTANGKQGTGVGAGL